MNLKAVFAASALALVQSASPSLADEPDGLKLPPGFHGAVVADGLTGMRHLAVRSNGDVYISTRGARNGPELGVIALHIGPDGKADQVEHFGAISGGTGIRIHGAALYTTSVTGVYRFDFDGDALVPAAPARLVLGGIPSGGQVNRIVALDDKGDLYLTVSGSGNICTDPAAPKVGLNPCPSLAARSGVWRFDANKLNQAFPADGEQIATGLRDMDAFDWRPGDAVYGIMQGRNGTSTTWPDIVSAKDDDNIAEEMHRMTPGVNMGWPYTYYDGVRNIRLAAPEYGGDGKTPAKDGLYDPPALAFAGHSAPLDMVFYAGTSFPRAYRGGAFVAMHGGGGPAVPGGHNGYDVVYVPFDKAGQPGAPVVFADGFAGPTNDSKNVSTATYRPVGLAVAPDGSLYVADSQKGRLWRITYAKP